MRVAVVVGGVFLALLPAIFGIELALKARNPWGYLLLALWIPFFVWLTRRLHDKKIVNKFISRIGGVLAVCALAIGFYQRYA